MKPGHGGPESPDCPVRRRVAHLGREPRLTKIMNATNATAAKIT
jgi:hypothetical protein